MHTRIHIDYETYSEADIAKCGAWAYAAHPSTEVLLVGYAINGDPATVWDVAAGEPAPPRLLDAIADGAHLHAFNAQFEQAISYHHMWLVLGDLPPDRWYCTQAEAYAMSFAGSLDDVATAIGLPGKQVGGRNLIHKFCKPQPASRKVRRWTQDNAPEEWALFKSYGAQDVEAERAVHQWLNAGRVALTNDQQRLYWYDQQINQVGLPVDTALVHAALMSAAVERERLMHLLHRLTGLDNPNSNTQLLGWLHDHGCPVPDMRKATLSAVETDDPVVREVLDLNAQLSKTSVSKWDALRRAAPGGRLRGAFQFNGASRTGRWAGRLFQPQNLPRPSIDDPDAAAEDLLRGDTEAVRAHGPVMEVLSSTLRGAICAPSGKTLVACDLGSIETRLLGWVADCPAIMGAFAAGRDPYKVYASRLFGVGYDDVTKSQRQMAKPPVLGCGYRLGGPGLIQYAAAMGVDMTHEFADAAVQAYREQHPEVVQAWYGLERAAQAVTADGVTFEGYKVRMYRDADFLYIELPSGRRMHYFRPEVQEHPTPWGEMKDMFTYMGQDSFTKKWCRLMAHGGLLIENIIQAIARDVLVHGLQVCMNAGLPVVGHVHDEIIAEVSEDRGGKAVQFLEQAMSRTPDWAPGLLLTAEAEGYPSRRYRK